MSVPMFERVTTRYVANEDRLRIAGSVADGTIVLWLTQRLMRQLIPALARVVEQISTASAPEAVRSSPVEARRRELQQGFAQSAARAALEPMPPVKAQAPIGQWLVREVDVTPGKTGVRLVFKGSESEQAVAFAPPFRPLRQWLAIVHDQCLKSGWPMDCWPDWITGTPPQPPGKSTPLH